MHHAVVFIVANNLLRPNSDRIQVNIVQEYYAVTVFFLFLFFFLSIRTPVDNYYFMRVHNFTARISVNKTKNLHIG